MSWNWDKLIDLGGSLLGGYMEGKGAKDAANASAAGAQAGINEMRRQYDQNMALLYPQMQVGNQALNSLARLYGYTPSPLPALGQSGQSGGTDPVSVYRDQYGNGANLRGGGVSSTRDSILTGDPISALGGVASALGGARSSPAQQSAFANQLGQRLMQSGALGQAGLDRASQLWGHPTSTGGPGAAAEAQAPLPTGLDVFTASPDYQFRRNEGTRDINNSFAARGGALSGNALRGLTEYNSGLASQEFGNYFNRQAALAGIGQAATSQGVSSGNYSSGNIANLLGDQGNARASGVAGQTNAWTNTLQNLLSTWNRSRAPVGGSTLGGSW